MNYQYILSPYKRYNKDYLSNKIDRPVPYQEKFDRLCNEIKEHKGLVPYSYIVDNIKLGFFQEDLLGALSGKNKYYKDNLESWIQELKKNDLWKYFEKKYSE